MGAGRPRARLLASCALFLFLASFASRPASAQGSWATVTPMPTGRYGLGVVSTPDGRIYTVGGAAASGASSAVEAHDPATNAWTSRAPLPTARYYLAAAAGADGRIYAIGGSTATTAVDTVDVYDPALNAWSARRPLPTRRFFAAAATGADGRIYLLGGSDLNALRNTAEAYDPATNTWSAVAPMPTARGGHAAAAGADGRIYAIGGRVASTGQGTVTGAVEVYSPATDTWSTAAPMPTAREGLAAAAGADGRIYAIGGFVPGVGHVNTVEVYNPGTDTWNAAVPMPTPRQYLGAAAGADGRIYAVGGNVPNQAGLATAEVYTPLRPSDLLVGNLGDHSVKRYAADTGAFLGSFVAPGSGGLNTPELLFARGGGDLLVSSFETDAVLRYDAATGAHLSSFVPSQAGGLDGPGGLVEGPDGHVYVASYFTNRVLRYHGDTGVPLPSPGNSGAVFAAGGGMNGPIGIAFAGDGSLLVASSQGRSVLRYHGTTGAFLGAFVPAVPSEPMDLVFGPDGHLYVTVGNFGTQVLRYHGDTGAPLPSPGNSGAVFAAGGGLSRPRGLRFGPDGHLYVSSFGTGQVLRYHGSTGAFINTFIAAGSGGLNSPRYLHFLTPPCVPPPSGLIHWWPGDGDANDRVGANHGAMRNGAAWAPGKVGQGFRLDGVNDFVEVPDSPSLTPRSLSLEAWIRPAALNRDQAVVGKYDSTNPDGSGVSWTLTVLGSGRLRFGVYERDVFRVIDTDAPVVTPGVWQHVAGTFDVATQAIRIYRNGVAVPSSFVPGHASAVDQIQDSDTPVRLGAVRRGAGIGDDLFFGGLIDEVSLYNRALTAAEVQSLFLAGAAGKCTDGGGAPETSIGSGPAEGATVCANTATFCFAGSGGQGGAAYTFRWRLDDGAWQGPTGEPCVTLRDLADGPHAFEVAAVDGTGAIDPTPARRTFTVDTSVPAISEVAVTPGETEATVTWKTSKPATSQVEYGPTASYGTSTPLDAALKTSHSVRVTGLEPGTTYHYRAKSKDACDREAVSEDATFQTLSLPDLQIPAAGAPAETLTDRAFDLTWTLRNAGRGAAKPPWADRVYLSADAQPGGGDTLLGEFPFAQELAAGASADRAQVLSIPRSAVTQDAGDYYLVIVTDAANQVGEGANENNNVRAVPIRVRREPQPDLTIAAVDTPDAAFFGQEIRVRWTVRNAGQASTDAAGWTDRVYLSLDRALDAEDAQVGSAGNVSYLDPGESYVSEADVTLPRGVFGTYYLIVYTDRGNAVTEGNEQNNTGDRAIAIQVPPLPDLQVPSVVAPEEAFAGGTARFTWRVENRGTGPTPLPAEAEWVDAVYLSADETLDAGDRRLGELTRKGALTPGDGYSVLSQSFDIPKDLAGEYVVLVHADDRNRVYEYLFENNNVGVAKNQRVRIQNTPPDLVVAAADAQLATGGEAGPTLNLSWTVRNQGAFDTATGGWYDSIYLSGDANLDPGTDTLLSSSFHSGGLAAGASYDGSAAVAVPPCLSGTFYVIVVTDSTNAVFEYDPNFDAEGNNTGAPQQITIPASAPDLEVTMVQAAGKAQTGLPLSVTWTVANRGTGPTRQSSWSDRVYLGKGDTLDGSARLVGTFSRSGALAAGASYSRTESVTVPDLPPGDYHVFVHTDALSVVEECGRESNNTGRSETTVAVSEGPASELPDLLIASVDAPLTGVAGEPVAVRWAGLNGGKTPADRGAWLDGVYLSADATLDESDRHLGDALIAPPVGVGAGYPASATAVLPNVAPGDYFLIVRADRGNYVAEGDESNNDRAVPLAVSVRNVDLRVSAVQVPAEAYSGQAMTVAWTVTNEGAEAIPAYNWSDYVVVSRDQILDPTDAVIGYQVAAGPMAAGASYTRTRTVTLPPGITGAYYVFVKTDWSNAVPETNEANNLALAGPVTLRLPPPTDLVVTDIAFPAQGSPGEASTFRWTVGNQGQNAVTAGGWQDAVYLSADRVWDIDDALVGRADRNGPLAAGATYAAELRAELPAVTPGAYYVLVRTDVRNQVRESDERNNVGATAGTMGVDVLELQLGVPHGSDLRTGQERYYKVFVPAGETLRLRLDGQVDGAANELYVRYGAMASRAQYDYFYGRPFEADQEVVVPTTQAGYYYVLVRGDFEPQTPSAFVILAELVPFSITSVSPRRIGDNGQVTITLRGARFENNSNVRLVGGSTSYNAIKVWAIDDATIKARFVLFDAVHGAYAVELANSNGVRVSAEESLRIETSTGVRFDIQQSGDLFPRVGRVFSTDASIINTGNVDAPYVVVIAGFGGNVRIAFRRPPETLPRQKELPEYEWDQSTPGSFRNNDDTIASFILRDLEVGQQVPFSSRVQDFATGDFRFLISAEAHSRKEMVDSFREDAETSRQDMLRNPNSNWTDEIRMHLSSQERWWQFISYELVRLKYIEESDVLGPLLGGGYELFALPSFMCNTVTDDPWADCVARFCTPNLNECLTNAVTLFRDCREDRSPPGDRETHIALCTTFYQGARRACWNRFLQCGRDCRNEPQCKVGQWQQFRGSVNVQGCGTAQRAIDPNEKSGPTGYGPQSFLSAQQTLPYTINFENVPTATAAAQRVRVTDQLDANLDWRTLRLKEIGFNNYRVTVPDNRSFYSARLPLGPDRGDLLADVSAGLDIRTGQVRWTLTAIDPRTGEQPEGALLGLLPPNDASKRGEGYVTFTVQPKAGLPTGTPITNTAVIVFDDEEPIVTNTVSNTLDADAPTSRVAALPAESPATFTVTWTGDDPDGGSGLQSYDVYVSDNGGAYTPHLTGVTTTSAPFTGVLGRTYRFYSVARDNAGNVEAAPATPDATTTVESGPRNPVPVLSAIAPASALVGGPEFTLRVDGGGFVRESVVHWNGAARATTYVSATQLSALIPAADLAAPGSVPVTVVSPAPGGGVSEAKVFQIGQPTLSVTVALSREGNEVVARFTVANDGTGPAEGARLTSAVLGTAAASGGVPADLGTIGAGESRAATVRFASPPAAGTRVVLRANGTFANGGSFGGSFGGSYRVVVP